jgi:hypothetical protein
MSAKTLIAYFPRYDTDRIENEASTVSCVFVAAVTFTEPLPSNDWEIFTEQLRNNDRKYTYRHKD